MYLQQKKIMMGYRRTKNLWDHLVKADCSLPKNFQVPASTEARDTFLRGTNPPPLAPSQRTKQSSMASYINKNINPQAPLIRTSSNPDLTHAAQRTPIRSSSTTEIAKPNLLKNKCIARKACRICPILNTIGTITCHVTKKVFSIKKNITCRSSNLIYCISCKTCGKQYVGQTKNTILVRFQGHFSKIQKCLKLRREDPVLLRQQEKDAVGNHFSADDHNGTRDLNISVLAYISAPPDSQRSLEYRLKVEKEWIHRLRCPAPRGLNILD